MITTKDQLTKASPKTRRTVRYEYELEHEALDCVFDSNTAQDFRFQVNSRVMDDPRFAQLPAYRQIAVDAYIRGALDYAARSKGVGLAEAPDAVQPKPRVYAISKAKKRKEPQQVGFIYGQSLPSLWTGSLQAAAHRPTRN